MEEVEKHSDTVAKEIFQSNDPLTRLAVLISKFANPFFVSIPLFLVVALYTASSPILGLIWWVITLLGMAVAPSIFILRGVKRGKITDHHVSDPRQRLIPLSFSLLCMVVTFIILDILSASRGLLATVASVIVTLAFCIIVTQIFKWKISLHASGMAGTVTALVFVLGPLWALCGLLIIGIGWARWRVHAHTVLQVLGGTILATVITIMTFFLFGF